MNKNKITYNTNTSTIHLNKNIYKKEAIQTTLKEYDDFLTSELKEENNYHILKLTSKNKDYTIKTLTDEFLNYLLGTNHQNK